MRWVIAIVLATAAAAALAGMPSVTLADVPRMRIAATRYHALDFSSCAIHSACTCFIGRGAPHDDP